MYHKYVIFICLVWVAISALPLQAIGNTNLVGATINRQDTLPAKSVPAKYVHIPQKATRRSAMIPGWGQAYNKQYWKIPLVYAALAIPAATFVFNDSYYKKTKFAYEAVYAANNGDASLLPLIDSDVKRADGTPLSASTYESARNGYRRNRDYSILYFLLMWGLNVADATVFGHLKNFDVSSDLSLQIQPSFPAPIMGGGINAGIAIAVQKRKKQSQLSK